MPEGNEEALGGYPMRLTDEFIDGLARVWSPRIRDHIRGLIALLPTNPQLGSPRVRRSLKERYGDNLRKLTVSTFVIIYRFDGEFIDILALVYGPNIS